MRDVAGTKALLCYALWDDIASSAWQISAAILVRSRGVVAACWVLGLLGSLWESFGFVGAQVPEALRRVPV